MNHIIYQPLFGKPGSLGIKLRSQKILNQFDEITELQTPEHIVHVWYTYIRTYRIASTYGPGIYFFPATFYLGH